MIEGVLFIIILVDKCRKAQDRRGGRTGIVGDKGALGCRGITAMFGLLGRFRKHVLDELGDVHQVRDITVRIVTVVLGGHF